MILLLWSVLAVAVGRFQIGTHYGVKGLTARICGGVTMLLAIGIVLRVLPIESLWVSAATQIALVLLVGYLAVELHGNDLQKESEEPEEPLPAPRPVGSVHGDARLFADEELLRAWATQRDYAPEMVASIAQEIARRGLHTEGIHVLSRKELVDEYAAASQRNSLRLVIGANGLLGLGLVLLAVSQLVGPLDPETRYRWSGPDLPLSLGVLAGGLLLMTFAYGLWRENRWILLGGVIAYLAALIMIVGGLVSTLDAWASRDIAPSPKALLGNIVAAIWSIVSAVACAQVRAARKQAALRPPAEERFTHVGSPR